MFWSRFISGPDGDRMRDWVCNTDCLVPFMSFKLPGFGLCFFMFVIWFLGVFPSWLTGWV